MSWDYLVNYYITTINVQAGTATSTATTAAPPALATPIAPGLPDRAPAKTPAKILPNPPTTPDDPTVKPRKSTISSEVLLNLDDFPPLDPAASEARNQIRSSLRNRPKSSIFGIGITPKVARSPLTKTKSLTAAGDHLILNGTKNVSTPQ